MSMKEMLLELREKALADLEAAASSQELQDLKVKYLGRKGPMTEILRGMGKVPAEERPKIGEIVNQVKQTLEQCLKDRTEILRAEALKRVEHFCPKNRKTRIPVQHFSKK